MNTTLKSLMMSLLVSQFSYICGAVIGDIPYMYRLFVGRFKNTEKGKQINKSNVDGC